MGGFVQVATPAVMLFTIALAAVPLGLTLNTAGADPHVPAPVIAEAAMLPVSPMLHLRSPMLPVPTVPHAPTPATPSSKYTVAPGDTLWDISQAAGVSVAALVEANHISDDEVLHPGDVLTLPPRGTVARNPLATITRPRLRWPLHGPITSRFGWRWIFYHRDFHPGIDIAAHYGAPVLAARDGRVRFAGWVERYGNRIVVDHGHGLATTYSHLEAILVKAGQLIQEGELIGRIGSTGESTGPHLHFEVLRNHVPVDPSPFLP